MLFAVAASLLVALPGSPALAIYPKLSTNLSGPAINGVVPRGDAKVDQSKLPNAPGTLELRVGNVNLPDGTELLVEITGPKVDGNCEPVPTSRTQPGSFTLREGEGSLTATLRFAVGRTDQIFVKHAGRVILCGGGPWQV